MRDLSELETILNYKFKNIRLLEEALSHSSYANENRDNGIRSNERLEFLGDSVLSIVVSDYIFKCYDKFPEGELTRVRATLVCEKTLFGYSREMQFGDFLKLGKGEEHNKGNERSSILADAFEAVLAAIYLDGGMEAARRHVMRFVEKDVQAAAENIKDYKTLLQEIIQRNPGEILTYNLKSESGPDHDKCFTFEVLLNSNIIGEGSGHSKKAAEQAAARKALQLMGENV